MLMAPFQLFCPLYMKYGRFSRIDDLLQHLAPACIVKEDLLLVESGKVTADFFNIEVGHCVEAAGSVRIDEVSLGGRHE